MVRLALARVNGNARLEITDTGSGISAEHLSRIFDRFYRVDRARSSQHGGAGLGLSICRMIADCHGGSIDMSSTPNEGTSVVVTIPETG